MQKTYASKASAKLCQIVVALALAIAPALAQLDQGQISGTVRDPAGGVVTGAKVSATNPKLGEGRSVVTAANGYFVITSLPVGIYNLTVQSAGFKSFVKEGIKLDAASRVSADVELQVGAVAETLTVTASATQLQQESAQIGRIIDSRQISDIALNGRNPMYLALLKPGVSGGDLNAFNPDSLNMDLVINGGQSSSVAIVFDGVNAVRTRSGTAPLGVLNPDAIQEVQVLTASYAAEYGRSLDGQVRFVSKSGTRDFHGTAYEFFRNSALDANSWVRNTSPNPSDNSRPTPFRFNQPGYTIGGPVSVPGKWNQDRNKLFFFLSQEWVRFRQSVTSTGTVPSAAMRTGDFSELLQPNNLYFNRVRTITDPLSRAPFPGNVIPRNRLSQNGAALLNGFPLPTPGFQQGTANWIASEAAPRDSRKDFIRADYYLKNHRIAFSGQNYSYLQVQPYRGNFDRVGTVQKRPNQTGSVSVTSTVTPRLVNEATFAAADDIVRTNNNPNVPYKRSLYGINYPYIFPGTKDVDDKIPTVAITGFSTLDGGPYPSWSTGPMYTYSDNVTWVVRPAHTLKFGFAFEHAHQNDGDQIVVSATTGGTNNQNGQFTFLDTGHPLTSGLAVANTALGYFNNYGEIGQRAYTLLGSNALEAFVQDTWRATAHLTVEIGLRYSYFEPWHATWNDIANFDPAFFNPAQRAVVDPVGGFIVSGDPYNGIVLPGSGFPSSAHGRVAAETVPGVNRLFHNLPSGFANADFNGYAPRLGVAYAAGNETVIRAGAGIFRNRTLISSTPLFGNPPNQLAVGVTNGMVDQPGGGSGASFPFQFRAANPDARIPTAYTYSFSVQRQLPASFVIDVAYVGKEGRHLYRSRNINQLQPGTLPAHPGINPDSLRPYLGLGVISSSETSGNSNYQSLQLSLDRRFSHGLAAGLAYTFAKGIDNLGSAYNAYNTSARAISSSDRTHLLNINFIYELPFHRAHGGGSALQRGASLFLGGWQLSGVNVVRSGSPLSVTDSSDIAGVGSGSGSQPWNLVGNPAYTGTTGVGRLWFNPAAFARPAPGTFGNAGLNILRGPGFYNLDLALFKNFRIVERLSAQFRAEAFNCLNHPNLSNPAIDPRSGSFGLISSKTGERNLQFGLKLMF